MKVKRLSVRIGKRGMLEEETERAVASIIYHGIVARGQAHEDDSGTIRYQLRNSRYWKGIINNVTISGLDPTAVLSVFGFSRKGGRRYNIGKIKPNETSGGRSYDFFPSSRFDREAYEMLRKDEIVLHCSPANTNIKKIYRTTGLTNPSATQRVYSTNVRSGNGGIVPVSRRRHAGLI